MVTLEELLNQSTYYHVLARNADGTALRCRANGRLKTWKRRPGEFRLPVKHGLRNCFYITQADLPFWSPFDPTLAGLAPGTPWGIVRDKALEMGLIEK